MANVQGAITYPNPLGYIYANDLRTWLWKYNPNLIGKDKLPNRSTERPNPPPVTWSRSWEWSYNKNLTGKDKQFRGPGQWATYDYPNPTDYPRLADYSFVTSTPLALKPLIPLPFNQTDWPTPQRVNWNIFWSSNRLVPIATALLPLPFDWGYQEKLAWYREWNEPGNVQLPFPPAFVQPPFSQLDYPNPRDSRDYKRSWEWSYNLNLIGKDQLPVGENVSDLPPRSVEPSPRRSWEWQYNQNLIGKDVVPGSRYTDRPDPVIWYRDWSQSRQATVDTTHQPLPFDWGYQEKLQWYREWNQNFTILRPVVVVAQAPRNQFDWPNPKDGRDFKREWYWQYNLNLIGKDKFPPGIITTGRPDPVIWYKDYNQNPSLYYVTPRLPFNQSDWPNPKDFLRVTPSWSAWYNLNLIGKDQLPTGKNVYDRPPPVSWYKDWIAFFPPPPPAVDSTHQPLPFDWGYQEKLQWYRDWSQNPLQLRVVVLPPFSQLDWPLPKDYLRVTPSWSASYNLNLIGKDIVPGKLLTTRPDPVIWYQSWIQGPIPPPPPLPFNQYDWPNPRDPRDKRAWEWWYNLNLIGKDQLPVGTITTARTPPGNTWYNDWSQNLQELTLRTSAVPFNQFDWPLPYPVYWFRDHNLNLVLIFPSGEPFFQTDWKVPPSVRWYQDYNQNLILVAPSSIPPQPPVVATPSGRVPKDYPHTWTWGDVAVPPAYRAIWKDEYKGGAQEVSEAAARLGRKGGIASGISRRK